MSTDRTEYMKHYMRRWRLKNPELVKQLRLKEKEKNIDSPERKREYNQRYYLTHKEQLSVSQHNNREKKNTYTRTWRKHHPEKALESDKKSKTKRKRDLGFIPINAYFKGSDAHHINETQVIYIPKELHKKYPHNHKKLETMNIINAAIIKWLQGAG